MMQRDILIMNKNKISLSVMSKKNSKNLILFSLLLVFLSNPLNARSRFETFCGYTLLTLGFYHAIALFGSCPYLYETDTCKTQKEYLDFLEERMIGWQFLLENPNEDQLNSFRYELLEYYEHILNKRSIFSISFKDSMPYQPWALFREEIQQHLTQLSSYKFDRFFKQFDNDTFNTNLPIESQELIGRVNRLETILNKIKKQIQPWPAYQNECSQARQEAAISNIYNFLGVFYCFYFANQSLKD